MELRIFAERVKELRAAKNLTAQELGVQAGLSKTAIILWENQKRWPSAENVSKLARFFGVSSDYLMGNED